MPLPTPNDVRMRGFARRVPVADAISWLDSELDNRAKLPTELVHVTVAANRVLAEDVISAVNVPSFRRAMMDGYAVRAENVSGATSYNRLRLQIVGEVLPGGAFTSVVQPGQAVRIMTGAPVPEGADAVLPAELTEVSGDNVLAIGDVSPQKNIGKVGEDIAQGAAVLVTGRKLRPQDVGVLASIGAASIQVIARPRVRIVVTGNELLPPGEMPQGSRIVDSNSPMLAALIERDGGAPVNPGIIPDDPDSILQALKDDADITLVSGGSSVGQEDHAPRLVAEHGELAIHGVAMRPSSPAGMGFFDGRLVFLLPNPVSCLCAYDFFAGRAVRCLAGLPKAWPHRQSTKTLTRKLVSAVGRVDYARVKLNGDQIEPLAISGASVLSSTTRADGFVIIPADSEGYADGTEVTMYWYE